MRDPPSRPTFLSRGSEAVDAKSRGPFDIFGFSRHDEWQSDSTAGDVFREASRMETRRANHSTHARHRIYRHIILLPSHSFFPPSVHIVRDAAALYIFLCCVKRLSPRYSVCTRDALLQRYATRYALITYSLVSFRPHDGPLMFNLLRALGDSLYAREPPLFLPGQHRAEVQRERTSSRIIKFLG